MQIIQKNKQQYLTCPHCLKEINLSNSLKRECILNFMAGFFTATGIVMIVLLIQTLLMIS